MRLTLVPVPLHRDAILAEARLKSLKASINDPEAARLRQQISALHAQRAGQAPGRVVTLRRN